MFTRTNSNVQVTSFRIHHSEYLTQFSVKKFIKHSSVFTTLQDNNMGGDVTLIFELLNTEILWVGLLEWFQATGFHKTNSGTVAMLASP